MFGKVSFLLFIKRAKKNETAEDMKIDNSQLVLFTGPPYRSTLASWQSKETSVDCMGALLVGFLCCMLQKNKKDNRACVLHYCQERERESKRGFKDTTYKYEAVPDHPATATQRSY